MTDRVEGKCGTDDHFEVVAGAMHRVSMLCRAKQLLWLVDHHPALLEHIKRSVLSTTDTAFAVFVNHHSLASHITHGVACR